MNAATLHAATLESFEAAIRVYKETPSAEHLLHLNLAAIPLMSRTTGDGLRWKPVECPHAFDGDFYEIRVLADRRLDSDEVSRLSGCLGYALRQTLAGEDLSDPSVCHQSGVKRMTTLEFAYDSTKCRRDDPDLAGAFDLARHYIETGTPLRSTNRSGAGTKGTRLVGGIDPCNLQFFVR